MPSRRNRSTATKEDTTVSTDNFEQGTAEPGADTTLEPTAGTSLDSTALDVTDAPVEPDADVDVETPVEVDDEVEEIPNAVATDGSTEGRPAKAPKEKAQPKRGELPDGMVTPIGLTKAINEQGLYRNREGEVAELKPQMVYSYIKNAPKDRPYPGKTVTDSVGTERENVCTLEEGLAWWNAKNEAAEQRRKNAAEKAAKKSAAAEKKAASEDATAETDEPVGAVEEAE